MHGRDWRFGLDWGWPQGFLGYEKTVLCDERVLIDTQYDVRFPSFFFYFSTVLILLSSVAFLLVDV